MAAAYDDPEGVARWGSTLYVSGTHTVRDVWDDVKVPFHMVHKSQRYSQAIGKMTHDVTTVVGHSLGGAVAARMTEDYPGLQARTYGAPLLHTRFAKSKQVKSYRHYGDPVSFFDRSAVMLAPDRLNPHSYEGFGNQ